MCAVHSITGFRIRCSIDQIRIRNSKTIDPNPGPYPDIKYDFDKSNIYIKKEEKSTGKTEIQF